MGNKGSKSNIKLQDLKLKIVLVGDAGSGKSSVMARVTANQFSYHYSQTNSVHIGNMVKKINHPVECKVSISIWDMPGNEDVDLRKSYYQDADAGVIIVNITDTESIARVPDLKQSILNITHTSSEFATKETELGSEQETLVDLPTLVLGNKVDDLNIPEHQETLHPNVELLSTCSDSCTGWVPVSAKENDRSIDLAFTSFVRYLVEKKLNLRSKQYVGYTAASGGRAPQFVPPKTAATRLREAEPVRQEEDHKIKLIQHEKIDAEFLALRKNVDKIERANRDWAIAYRRFCKSAKRYCMFEDGASTEEFVLCLKEALPISDCLQVEEFQGWIKLELDEDVVEMDEMPDAVLEVVDSFNYDLVPNAAYVVNTANTALVELSEARERLLGLSVPRASVEIVRANNSILASVQERGQRVQEEVRRMRKCVELAVMW